MVRVEYHIFEDPVNNTFVGTCECGFESKGWPKASLIKKRMKQHQQEHETTVPMQELADFNKDS